MTRSGIKNVIRYVVPAILSNICFFLFTITDAVFIGRGIGTNALGAMNLINPFILVMGAVNMLISIGGVAIYAVRIGRGMWKMPIKYFVMECCLRRVFRRYSALWVCFLQMKSA